MRTGKRTLAGVAAVALGAALIPFVGVGVSQAATGNATNVTTSPIRVTFTNNVRDVVPNAVLSFRTPLALTDANAAGTFTLATAPTAATTLTLGLAGGDESASLGVPAAVAAGDVLAADVAAGDTVTFPVFIEDLDAAAGLYGYSLVINDGFNTVTVTSSFTTTGRPTSMSLAINVPSAPKNFAVADLATVTLRDGSNRVTQPTAGDTVAITTNEAGAFLNPVSPLDDADLATGVADIEVTTAGNAGTFTFTATPQGTLPGGGVTTQTGQYTVIDNADAAAFVISDSANVVNTGAGTADVRPGTTSLTFAVVVAPADAGKPVAVAVAGTAIATPYIETVATNSSGRGVLTVPVSAGRAIDGNDVTLNAGATFTATYANPAVTTGEITRSPSAPTIALATGASQAVTVTVADQYGVGRPGWPVTATANNVAGTQVSGVTGADGTVTLTLPDLSTASVTTVVWTFASQNPGGGAPLAAPTALTLIYGTGTVTLTGLQFDATAPASYAVRPAVPFDGAIGVAPASTGDQEFVAVTVNASVPNTQVTFSGTPGTWFDEDGAGIADIGATGTGLTPGTLSVVADGAGVATVYVTSTTTGVQTFTATSTSGSSLSGTIRYVNDETAARNVAVSADPTQAQIGTGSTVAVDVSDAFGNAVQLLPGGPTVTLQTNLGSLAGGVSIFTVTTTNAAGRASVSLISPLAGTATVGALGTGGQFGDDADDPFTGAAESVDTGSVDVTFSTAPASQSILILDGARNGQRIETFGTSTGFDMGALLSPWIRFPGQTGFTQGTAQIMVDDEGDWNWGRNTGKRTAVQIRSLVDPTVRSNTVIIPAR